MSDRRPSTGVEAVAWALAATVTENDAASVTRRASGIVDHLAGDGWQLVPAVTGPWTTVDDEGRWFRLEPVELARPAPDSFRMMTVTLYRATPMGGDQ